ncbi:MAG: PAS domain-containing protein [Gammaproteobacteria bacterium]|nr:PAS domain-containing protein [Gammaproteobacteria bacterium]
MTDLSALSNWAPEIASALVSLSSDIALVIDEHGTITTVVTGNSKPIKPIVDDWLGRAWVDTATADTRRKIELALRDVVETGVSRRREVNHPTPAGVVIPIAYTAIRLGANGPVLVVGQDLRAVAAIQQRFLETQQELEREYWSVRQAEERERQLLQIASDAVLVVDPDSLTVLKANRACTSLLGIAPAALLGTPARNVFSTHSRPAVDAMLQTAHSNAGPVELAARLQSSGRRVLIAVSPLTAEAGRRLLLRARVDARASDDYGDEDGREPEIEGRRDAHDGDHARPHRQRGVAVVVTDSRGGIVAASPTFLHHVQVLSETEVRATDLADWLGAGDRSAGTLIAGARGCGLSSEIETVLVCASGRRVRVVASAVLLTETDQECVGITLRPTDTLEDAVAGTEAVLAAVVARTVGRLGGAQLDELLGDGIRMLEAELISAALARNEGNVAAAAGQLRISAEDLDRRLRSLADPPPDDTGAATIRRGSRSG